MWPHRVAVEFVDVDPELASFIDDDLEQWDDGYLVDMERGKG